LFSFDFFLKQCQEFGHILRQTKGLYLSIEHHKGRLSEVLANWPSAGTVKAIVVTDGERILGLGDLGAFGMGIPVGKLQLYTACGGVDPEYVLPICIDVGTNTQKLLDDPLYTGIRNKRVTGLAYDEFIEEFVTAVKAVYGEYCLIQWEDFGNQNAHRILRKFADQCCTFNDDIQGTASVVLGGIIGSLRVSHKKLSEHTYLIVGAGEAGLGIAELISNAIMDEKDITIEEAREHIFLVDSRGLITKDRPTGGINHEKAPYAHSYPKHIDNLHDTIMDLSPSVLIGVTAQPKIFTKELVQHISSKHVMPLIFPLSNPTSKAECTAVEAYTWTNGNCVFASGSPFGIVELNGKKYIPGQGNNTYIFPGVALAIVYTNAKRVTDDMMMIAAKTLADCLTDEDVASGRVYPPLEKIRDVSARIAAAVGAYIFDHNLTTMEKPTDLLQYMRDKQYKSVYPSYE
jgi:malate dehydrogenase (oxaloacetate-decarboxylating)(NADP+)